MSSGLRSPRPVRQWLTSVVFAAVCSDSKLYIYDLKRDKHSYICDQKIVKRMKPTHVAFNPFDPIIVTGEDKGGCSTYRLSAGLTSAQAAILDPKKVIEMEKKAMDEFISSLDKELY
jgi:hypothetical protein